MRNPLAVALGLASASAAGAPAALSPATQPAASIERTSQWKLLVASWEFADVLASTGKSTQAQRHDVRRALDATAKGLAELVEQGALGQAEAGLLRQEGEYLHGRIVRNPPTDLQVMCYDMAYLPPARESFERLSKRLPMLEQAVASGKLHPAAMEKLLPALAADLKVMGESSEPQEKAKALKLAEAVNKQLEKARLLAGPAPAPATAPARTAAPATPAQRLAADSRWQRVEHARKLAQVALADPSRPVPENTRAHVLVSLSAAETNLDELRKDGLLDEARWSEMKRDLSRLASQVSKPN